MWYTHTMEYYYCYHHHHPPPHHHYLAIKRNEVLIHTTMCMNIENDMLNKRSQTQRPYIIWLELLEMSRIGKCIEIERLMVARQAGGRREWGTTANGCRVYHGGDETICN